MNIGGPRAIIHINSISRKGIELVLTNAVVSESTTAFFLFQVALASVALVQISKQGVHVLVVGEHDALAWIEIAARVMRLVAFGGSFWCCFCR